MRLTALCVCGTLLAFSSLSWTTEDSDDERDLLLLGDNGFGPCTVTLRPEGPCRQSQDESTCPYLFSLPPLTVHLPKELRELEKIVEDLQQLKDNVDELRKMCADCTVSQTERECAKQREHEKLNEGTDRHKDERNWMNERKDFSKECWTDRLKAEKTTEGDSDTDFEKRHFLDEKERKKWETEREGNKGVIKGNEYEETLQEKEEKDGKTQTEGAKGKDKVGQANVPTASGDDRTVDMVRKKIVEKNNSDRQTDRNGNSKVDREDVQENGKGRNITSNLKNEKKTDESDHHVWRDETTEGEKNTQTEADRGGDGIKMSEDHDKHTNKEREQHREERKKEMEKRIKVERNNENTKQTERTGRTEKEKTIKEGEVEEEEKDRETGKEIKTEGEKVVQSVQRDSDGELTSSKAIERTDFVSINPTLHSTISLAPRHGSLDSNEAITLTSSLPSPPLSSSTSYLITGVKKGTTTSADGPTQSTGLGAADISEHPRPDAEADFRPTATATISTLGGPEQQITSSTNRFTSTTSVRPGAGLQGTVSSTAPTTTPHQNLYTTTFPGGADRSRWTAKKNISSNAKTGVKPPPGRGPKPGEKRKPAIKPEADRKLKNPENDRKPHQAPSPDKKTKTDQKQKPSHQKPTINQKFKPGKDPKRVQIQKPDQRPLPDNLPTDQNLKNIQIPKHDQDHTTDQNQQPVQKPKSHPKLIQPVQRPTAPHQRPQAGNVSGYDKDLLTDREAESVEIPIINQNSKPEKHPDPPFKTVKPDQKQKPKSEEKPKPDRKSTVNQHVTSVEELEPDRGEIAGLTPKSNQKPETELMENSEEKLLSEPKSVQDSSPRLIPDHGLIKPRQKIPKINQKPKPGQTPKRNQKHPELQTKPNVKPKPGQTPKHPEVATGQNVKPQPDQTPNQKYPGLTTSQHVKPKPDQTPDQKHLEVTTGQNVRTTPDQTPNQKHPGLTTSQHVKPKADQTPDQKYLEVTTGQNMKPKPDQTPKNPEHVTKPNVKPLPDHEPKDPGLTTGQNVKTKPDQTPNQKQPGLTTGQNVKTKTDQTPDRKRPEPATGQNVKPKPNQTPKYPELTMGQNVEPKPDQTPDQTHPEVATGQHVKPKPDQTPDQKHLELTTGQNRKPKPDTTPHQHHPELTTGQNVKPLPDQTPKRPELATGQKTEPDLTLNQNHPGLATGQNVKPLPDQTPKNPELTTGQNVKPIPDQTPKHPEPATGQNGKPLSDQTPKHPELITGQNVKPLPNQTPKHPELVTGQNVKPLPDQTPKHPELITGQNVKPLPDQTLKHPEPATGPNVKPLPDQTPKHPELVIGQNVKPLPDQKPKHPELATGQKTEPDQSPYQKDLELATGQNVNTKPDQTFNQKYPELVIGQNVKPIPNQTPKHPEPATGQNMKPKPNQTPKHPELVTGQNVKPKPNQTPKNPELVTGQNVKPKTDQTPKHLELPTGQNAKPKPDQTPDQTHSEVATGQDLKPKPDQTHSEVAAGQDLKPKPDQMLQANQGLKTPQPGEMPDLNPKSVPDKILEAESKNTSNSRPLPRHRPPTRPTMKPGATSVQRPKPSEQLKPSPKTKTDLDPQFSRTTSDSIQNTQTDMPPTSGLVKQTADVTHSPGDTEFSPSEMKTITLDPKTSNSLETGPFPRLHALPESFTMSPHSRITSDLRPQTAGQPSSIPITTRPNKIMREIFPSVTPRTSPGSTKPNAASNTDSRIQPTTLHNVEETAPRQTPDKDKMMIPVPSPRAQTTSTTKPDLRSTASAPSFPDPMAPEVSTPSARELRVKINQVAAFFNNSFSPNGRLPDRRPIEHPEDNQGGSRPDRMDSKLPTRIPPKVTMARRDCSDYLLRGVTKSGVYLVTPDLRSRSFPVFCDMELNGGGWTVLQLRQDGSVSFNRTWAEYRSGFGDLDGGEFWLGNNMMHLLTRDRDMMLRVELEDFDGVMEYAEYEQFTVAGERLRYRLTVGGYSGTAGDALRFSKTYDHNNRAFTTPDRDNDRYPSGNCGAYYSSGWWFDACMAANLNGRYYEGKYKGVRDGIFWGTWHNISTEYYPTNDRQSFKRVRMMIRPKGFRQ